MAYYTVTYVKPSVTPKEIAKNLIMWEILQGLALTFKHMFQKPITMRYPEEKWVMPLRWRAQVALVRKPETPDKDLCVACAMCVKVCPSNALEMETGIGEDGKKTTLDHRVNMVRCVYCGWCEEICPVNAIVQTDNYETAKYTREEMILDKKEMLRMGKIWQNRVKYFEEQKVERSEVALFSKNRWTLKPAPEVTDIKLLREKGLEYNEALGFQAGYDTIKIPKKAMT